MIRSTLLLGLLSLSALAQLPNPKLTPGATLKVGIDQICKPGYSKKARKVSTSTKRYVAKMYGIPYQPKLAEMDHLISLSSGGSNTVNNLWPQPYEGPWNAKDKDRLEEFLYLRICRGDITLNDAQRALSVDWTASYRRYFGTVPGSARSPRQSSPAFPFSNK